VGASLVDKTLAVMGFGKVGSEVARRAKGLGMVVIAHDPDASADRAAAIGVELVSFEDALARSDFLSLHMPLTPTTNKVFNDETFAKCKKGVRLVNAARGGHRRGGALPRPRERPGCPGEDRGPHAPYTPGSSRRDRGLGRAHASPARQGPGKGPRLSCETGAWEGPTPPLHPSLVSRGWPALASLSLPPMARSSP